MLSQNIRFAVFGNLSFSALPFYSVIATIAASMVVLGAIACIVVITRAKAWTYLWKEWFTSVDHKRVGIMYVIVALIMLLRAAIEAILMRVHQATAFQQQGILPPEHFAQLFTTHGTIMIFFMAMPFLIGLFNLIMPLQIGARDVSFPVMNSVSLGMTIGGSVLMMISLVLGKFSTGGWSGYPPYTELAFSNDMGVDYWIWALTLSSLSTTMTGINFAATIYKKRCEGMTLMAMPLFTWTCLCTSILMIFAMPAITLATALLALDRYADMHFFTNGMGGNMMNYINMFWLFGHPEVYILVLPAFGVFSETIATFSGKTLYGYTSLIYATMVIAVLSFTVWLHHFFTMGQDANVNAIFGIATMLIGIPTGVKIYDWLLTMFRGEIRLTVPMLYAIGFMILFTIGGCAGIVLANPGVDYQVHNTLFLVAHFHNVIIPGTLFGMLSGYHYWFPKAFGFRLSETWGRRACLCWIAGFVLAFFPLYALGLLGMPRRTAEYFDPAYRPWTLIAAVGALIIAAALACLVIQLVVSIRDRAQQAVPIGDPWDGRTLEWSIAAPPPEYNFAVLPTVHGRDAFLDAKHDGSAYRAPEHYEDIVLPKNAAIGPVICVAGGAAGFALTWHIWWLAIVGVATMFAALIVRSFNRDTERVIPAAEVRETEEAWLRLAHSLPPRDRNAELSIENEGLATVAAE
ncbi:ubiquinol oxidase polypeptide I [Tanticharoenia sakaeratensis NBRC 103193]|uniref:Ubiquinol oxidase polypeptide I n=1 Tax=Tanticharoenia sakaeratensis NBRC 103193 TaxID=1231623 RepID=A0A0D6MJR9_9PROT|nr:cbb3-type cytochrome c oxidase subunit I [Tanticharoenia sakaeratensis]GAN53523.1 ubiquinol oxidase polypeptide I [Tanticharoenia sakaeratensis NBRC 103193]GBQ17659.1 cytochrome o ubiquinol oxidase subunit I [Tanticharoenia sakaeratensis NBRC 103193]